MRFLTTGWMAVFILVSASYAYAKTYPPTTAGVRELVTDDAAMLPPAYATKLRKQEVDWEHRTGAYSNTPYVPSAQKMIQGIQTYIFTLNGYMFDDKEWSASFAIPPDTTRELGGMPGSETPIQLDQNIPVIVSPLDPKAIAFNVAIENYVESIWKQAGGPSQTASTDDDYLDLALTYSPNFDALPGIISINLTLNSYTHGAMQGGLYPANFNWDIMAGRQVTPEDIFAAGTDWQNGVAQAAIDTLKRSGNVFSGSLQPDELPIVDKNLIDPKYWAILKEGLRVETDSELCGYDCSDASAIIPWSSLRPYLKPDGLVQNF